MLIKLCVNMLTVGFHIVIGGATIYLAMNDVSETKAAKIELDL